LQLDRSISEHYLVYQDLQKDWEEVTKNDIDILVLEIIQKHSDESGKETNYSYDHKKILKIFIRWMKLGSREFVVLI